MGSLHHVVNIWTEGKQILWACLLDVWTVDATSVPGGGGSVAAFQASES